MNFKIILCLAIALTFIACTEDSPAITKPEQENSSNSENPMLSSSITEDTVMNSSSETNLPVSSSLVSSSSSLSCVESVDDVEADIYTTNIEKHKISCGPESEGMRVFDMDHSILMTCVEGTLVETHVEICDKSSSNSSSSVEAVEVNINYGVLEDPRDGQSYKTVNIGGVEWMAENMNFYESADGSIKVDSSFCYNDLPSNCSVYGRLYQSLVVNDVCPDGWHVPTNSDWSKLNSLLSYEYGSSVGEALRKDEWTRLASTNQSGFGALSAGYRAKTGGYYEITDAAFFWGIANGVKRVWEINAQKTLAVKNQTDAYSSYSVRCVKN